MCEIIRAFVANHKFPLPIDLGNIPSEITEHIKCAGKTGINFILKDRMKFVQLKLTLILMNKDGSFY